MATSYLLHADPRKVAGSPTNRHDPGALINIPKVNSWVSYLLPSISRRQGERQIQISLDTTIYFYPAHFAWLTVKTLPQSPDKTVMQYDLYARTGHNPKHLGLFIQKLKDATSTENARLESIQIQLIENTLSLDDRKPSFHHAPLKCILQTDRFLVAQIIHQEAINALLTAHRKFERLEGREVYPAARQTSRLTKEGQQDDDC
jgi:hypothetical protein